MLYLLNAAVTADDIVGKIETLVREIWPILIGVFAAIVVIWGAVIGIRYIIANKNDEKMNAKESVKQLLLGVLIMAAIAMAGPLVVMFLGGIVEEENPDIVDPDASVNFITIETVSEDLNTDDGIMLEYTDADGNTHGYAL